MVELIRRGMETEKFWYIVNPEGFYWDNRNGEWTRMNKASMFNNNIKEAFGELPVGGTWEAS